MQKIRIDFDNPGLPQHISAVENDSQSRFFQAMLYENGKAYTAPEGAAYSIMYRGFGPQNQGWYDTINDGAGRRAACAVSGNVVTCEIARQALQVPGHVSIVLCVTTRKGYMLKSWPIECDCKNDRYDNTVEIQSFFYVTQISNESWTQAIQAVEELKNTIDPTLSLSGKAADAAKVGEVVAEETTRAKAAEEANANGIREAEENVSSIIPINLFDCRTIITDQSNNWEIVEATKTSVKTLHKNNYSTGAPTAPIKLPAATYTVSFVSNELESVTIRANGVASYIKSGDTFVVENGNEYILSLYYPQIGTVTISDFTIYNSENKLSNIENDLSYVEPNANSTDGLLFMNTVLEIGGIDNKGDTTQGHRARTVGFLKVDESTTLTVVDSSRKFIVYYYDTDEKPTEDSGWSTSEIDIIPRKKFRIVYAMRDETGYPRADINAFYKSVKIKTKIASDIDKVKRLVPLNFADLMKFQSSNATNWKIADCSKTSVRVIHNNQYTTGSPVCPLFLSAGKYRLFADYTNSIPFELLRDDVNASTLLNGSIFEIESGHTYSLMISSTVAQTYEVKDVIITQNLELYILPYYYKNEIDDCREKIAEINPENFNLIVLSDIHKHFDDFTDEKLRHIITSVVELANSLNIDAVLNLGDTCEGGSNVSKKTSLDAMALVADMMGDIQKPVLWAFGNHDNNEYDAFKGVYASRNISHYITTNNWVNYFSGRFNGDKSYYYVDFPAKQVRVIVANVCDYGDSIESDGTISFTNGSDAITCTPKQLTDIGRWIDESPYNNVMVCGHSDESKLMTLLSEKNKGNKNILCYAFGHHHNDALEFNERYGIPISSVSCASASSREWGYSTNEDIKSWVDTNAGHTNATRTYKRVPDTIAETSFDILSISENGIKKIKFGCGIDMEINY